MVPASDLPTPFETVLYTLLKSFIISKTIWLCQKANPALVFIK